MKLPFRSKISYWVSAEKISLPGTGEAPSCPVFVEGRQVTTLHGDAEALAEGFLALLNDYVERRFQPPTP